MKHQMIWGFGILGLSEKSSLIALLRRSWESCGLATSLFLRVNNPVSSSAVSTLSLTAFRNAAKHVLCCAEIFEYLPKFYSCCFLLVCVCFLFQLTTGKLQIENYFISSIKKWKFLLCNECLIQVKTYFRALVILQDGWREVHALWYEGEWASIIGY